MDAHIKRQKTISDYQTYIATLKARRDELAEIVKAERFISTRVFTQESYVITCELIKEFELRLKALQNIK